MVTYLDRVGVVPASHAKSLRKRGVYREYMFSDIVALRLVRGLTTNGVSPLHLKRAINALLKRHAEITPSSVPAKYLLVSGQELYFRDGDTAFECATNGQLAFSFLFEIDQIRKDVIGRMNKEDRNVCEMCYGTSLIGVTESKAAKGKIAA